MVVGKAVIVAGIGSRKGVSSAEVRAAIEAALREHGLAVGDLSVLATTSFKCDEAGIFEAGRALGLEVIVVETEANIPPPLAPPHKAEGDEGSVVSAQDRPGSQRSGSAEPPSPLWGGVRGGGHDIISEGGRTETCPPGAATLTHSALSLALAGVASVSEAAALGAAGEGARLLGPRMAVGRVTCAIAISGETP